MAPTREASLWLENLREFVDSRPGPPANGGTLGPLEDEQRRVTGGVLLQFLDFIQKPTAYEAFPVLESHPIDERIFVFATDGPGLAAADDLIDPDSDRAICVRKDDWRAWLGDSETDADEAFDLHYECWSAWHRQVDATWDIEPPEGARSETGQFWVHEEGFALVDRAGRGSRHVWWWDGSSLSIVEEEVEDWTSRPESASPES